MTKTTAHLNAWLGDISTTIKLFQTDADLAKTAYGQTVATALIDIRAAFQPHFTRWTQGQITDRQYAASARLLVTELFGKAQTIAATNPAREDAAFVTLQTLVMRGNSLAKIVKVPGMMIIA